MMKKFLSLLLACALVLTAAVAFAETAPVAGEPFCPFAYPALPEEIHTQWQLFAQDPVLEWKMTAASDPETNCFVVTLFNPLEWGISEEYCGSWKYDLENTKWVSMEEPQPDISAGAVVLYMDAEEYYMNGFPGWQAYSGDEYLFYMLEDYSDDPNNPDYFLNCVTDDASIQYSLGGQGYTLSSFGEDTMSYNVYDANGTLTMGSYTKATDEAYVNYAVIPNESSDPEAVAEEPYILYYINVQTPDGGNFLWTEGAWQNIHGEEVPAPEGYSPDDLPFELICP
ncbi:MAG: hypothetical protein E7323_10385 [Clostridiales bacterium]|nr:hypothetical protein [Clostridiales bacterium]